MENIYNLTDTESVTMKLSRYESLMDKIRELEEDLTKDSFMIYTRFDGIQTTATGVYKTKEAFEHRLISDIKEKDLKIKELRQQLSVLRGKNFFQRLFNY